MTQYWFSIHRNLTKLPIKAFNFFEVNCLQIDIVEYQPVEEKPS